MALHSLNHINRLKDPLKQFQIAFTISDLPALKAAKAAQKTAEAMHLAKKSVMANTEELELRCTSFSYPGIQQYEQTELVIAGFRRKLATIQNRSGVWNCAITEDFDGSVLNTIQAWCDLIHNPFNGMKTSSSVYVSTCNLRILNEKGEATRTLWLKGFYPLKYSVNNIEASSQDAVTITIDWNYDWWTETGTSISALGI